MPDLQHGRPICHPTANGPSVQGANGGREAYSSAYRKVTPRNAIRTNSGTVPALPPPNFTPHLNTSRMHCGAERRQMDTQRRGGETDGHSAALLMPHLDAQTAARS